MEVEFSTLRIEPGRVRVRRATLQRLLEDPVELVDQVAIDGGVEMILRSRTILMRAVVSDSDVESLTVAAGLARPALDPAELADVRIRLEAAAQSRVPAVERFSDAQQRQQAKLAEYRRRIRANTLRVAIFVVILAVIASLAR